MQPRQAVVIDAVRTPVGKYGGALKDVRPDDLAALVIKALLSRNPQVDPGEVEEVYLGCTNQAGEDNRNVARMAVLLSGLPVHVGGVTVNRLCASGLEAINHAARAIALGDGDVYIAGGVESMTRAPFVMAKHSQPFERSVEIHDTTIGWRFTNPRLAELHYPYSMGETAENVAERYGISREDQDAFALESQRRAGAALAAGRFRDETVPVPVPGAKKGETVLVDTDEHPRPSVTAEQLARLKPAFKAGGTVTAGNSSGINDGAAALLLMSEERARSLGLTPMATIVSSAAAGVDPALMGIGPIPAVCKALGRAKLTLEEIDLVELNEAFAAQSLAVIRELGLDPARVNVNGGAIALGHPLGCTGARLMTTLLHEMRRREARYGLVTLCVGVGQGLATVVRRP